MKSKFTIVSLLVLSVFFACNKSDRNEALTATSANGNTAQQNGGNRNARKLFTPGDNYSKSIPIDTANKMILSYLASIHFPSQDTSLRCLYFDADTLRAYLSDPNITTVKFVLAHQQNYLCAATYGKFIGMKPNAMTMIIAGVDDAGVLVKNTKGEVYEHAMPCPNNCPESTSDGLLH